MTNEPKRTIYSRLIDLSFIGLIIYIANCYAYNGDPRAKDQFAPAINWIRYFWVEVFIAVALTCLTLENNSLTKISHVAFSVFPSLLGFGIGVYALIFGLSNKFISNFQQHIKESREKDDKLDGSVLGLNSAMALPLVICLFTLFVNAIVQFFPTNIYLSAIALFFVWLSFIYLFELIKSIYELADNSLSEKSKE